jgi:hypothetical protein
MAAGIHTSLCVLAMTLVSNIFIGLFSSGAHRRDHDGHVID